MRRFLAAFALVAASIFLVSPAMADDETPGPAETEVSPDPGGSDQNDDPTLPEQAEPTSPDGELAPGSAAPSTSESQAADEGVVAAAQQKVTLCHRTNAETNPYREITVSVNSVIKTKGHDSHEGPVFELGLKDQGIKWGDIIPEFDHGDGLHYDGQNLTPEGEELLANGCQLPGEPPDEECPDDTNEECDEDEECEDDCDGVEASGSDVTKADALPDTGGTPMWPLLTGAWLVLIGSLALTSGRWLTAPVPARHRVL